MYTTVSKKISQNLVPSLKKEREKKKNSRSKSQIRRLIDLPTTNPEHRSTCLTYNTFTRGMEDYIETQFPPPIPPTP